MKHTYLFTLTLFTLLQTSSYTKAMDWQDVLNSTDKLFCHNSNALDAIITGAKNYNGSHLPVATIKEILSKYSPQDINITKKIGLLKKNSSDQSSLINYKYSYHLRENDLLVSTLGSLPKLWEYDSEDYIKHSLALDYALFYLIKEAVVHNYPSILFAKESLKTINDCGRLGAYTKLVLSLGTNKDETMRLWLDPSQQEEEQETDATSIDPSTSS